MINQSQPLPFSCYIPAALIALVLSVSSTPTAHAQPETPAPDALERTIEGGVGYLMARANDDGSVANGGRYPTASTALSIMALTAVGHQPTDLTPQGKLLRDAIAFILRDGRQTDEGYYGRADNSRMYGHGIVTLMLCELLGMGIDADQDRAIRDRAERAIDLILRAQQVNKHDHRYHGGWRYEPNSRDADLSVTVWQVMALRAGKAAGIHVPAQAIDDAVAYLERSYKQTGQASGGYGYEPGHQPRYATTAAGLLAMQVCGRYDHEQVIGAANFLRDRGPQPRETWLFYGSYYYAVGMDQAGEEYSEHAERTIWEVLSRLQRGDGSWAGQSHENDPVYATSMAILALSVRYHYLPIYQR